MTDNEILGFRSIAIIWKQISVTINKYTSHAQSQSSLDTMMSFSVN